MVRKVNKYEKDRKIMVEKARLKACREEDEARREAEAYERLEQEKVAKLVLKK